MAHQPEPFALALFEIHRLLTEASGNPLLRVASSVIEFGGAVAVQQRMIDEGSAPIEGLARAVEPLYEAMLLAMERG